VLGSYEGTAALLETDTLKRLADARVSESAVTLAKFNAQASQVLLGSQDGSIALYSIPNLERLYGGSTDNSEIAGGYFTETGFSVLTLAGGTYAYDGKMLSEVRRHSHGSASTIVPARDDRALVAGPTGAAWIVDNATGRRLVELKGHSGSVLHAAFDPGGSTVVTASEDGTGMVFDSATGARLEVLAGHQAPLSFVALSRDGRYIATASLDQTIRIWRRGVSTPLAVYRGHLASVQAVRFLPSGGLVSVSQDGELHSWQFDDDYGQAISTTRAMLPRCLTTKQLEAFGLKEPPRWCARRHE
jgi:WD40 repeat protein